MSRDPLEDQEYDFYNAPDMKQQESYVDLNSAKAQANVGYPMGVVRPGAITYVHNGKLSTVPEPMTAHKRISLVKSGFRLAGSILGIVALPHNVPMVAAFAMLALAEVLGILEENHEDD